MRRGRRGTGGLLFACLWLITVGGIQTYAESGDEGVVSAQPGGPANTTLPQRAYVWQRVWTPAVQQAVREHAPAFVAMDVLAAEISFSGPTPKISYSEIDWRALRTSGVPIALVVRIGPSVSSWDAASSDTRRVREVCGKVIAEAEANHVTPTELQLDFDAASSRLVQYCALLREIRATVSPPRLVITALPAWLGQPGFPALIHTADAYVLQVHSLEKPTSLDTPFTLCAAARAERWIDAASTLGRPFRVALPAYGYRVGYDASGRFVGLQAEGANRAWPTGTRLRSVWAEPREIASIVRGLMTRRPAALEAVCWFRLPTANDELAWHWRTLARVAVGGEPQSQLVLRATTAGDGSVDLAIVNTGDAAARPSGIEMSWPGAVLVAIDTLDGWRVTHRGDRSVVLSSPTPTGEPLLRPDAAVKIGWLRLSRPVAIEARVRTPREALEATLATRTP